MFHADLNRVIGLADACELLSVALAFPTEELAAAISDGTFGLDVEECLADAGVDREAAQVVVARIPAGQSPEEMFGSLRKEYSTIFLNPGGRALVFPYESAFLHRVESRPGAPVLFRTRASLDVERQMREGGVAPLNARQEPADSAWNEFSFLSFLYGSLAAAIYEDDEAAAFRWREGLSVFWSDHGARWLVAFFDQICEVDSDNLYGRFYTSLGQAGKLVAKAIEADIRSSSTTNLAI